MSPEYQIPITCRSLEFHSDVFDGAIETGSQSLCIGSGLSPVLLHPNVTSIDPRFCDVNQMYTDAVAHVYKYVRDPQSAQDQVDVITRTHQELVNRMQSNTIRVIPTSISPDQTLPFDEGEFDNAFSLSCMFGGLDAIYTPSQMTAMIKNCMRHVKPNGGFWLFPYFADNPDSIDPEFINVDRYSRVYTTQHAVVSELQSIYPVEIRDACIEPGLIPETKQTVIIWNTTISSEVPQKGS